MALLFNGTSDRIQIANEANFDFERTDTFSLWGWIRLDVIGAVQVVIAKRDAAGNTTGWDFFVGSNNKLTFTLTNTAGTNQIAVSSTSTLVANRFYHMAVTYDGSVAAAGAKLYLDGALEVNTGVTDNLTASILNNLPVYIGTRNNVDRFFDGVIAEVGVATKVLSKQEIEGIWRNPFSGFVPANWLKSHWRLCDKRGAGANTAYDLNNGTNNGTITGTTLFAHPLLDCREWIQDTVLMGDFEFLAGIYRELCSIAAGDTCGDQTTGFTNQVSLPEVSSESSMTDLQRRMDEALRQLEEVLNRRVLADEPCSYCPDGCGAVTIDLARCNYTEIDTEDANGNCQDINRIGIINGTPGQRPVIQICNPCDREVALRGWPDAMSNGMPTTLAARRCIVLPFVVRGSGELSFLSGAVSGSSVPFDARTQPGGSGGGSGGGGGACDCDPGDDHELTIKCCESACSMACNNPSIAKLKLEACGGVPPYTWATTAGTLSASTGRTVTLEPPTNTGSGVAGDAYNSYYYSCGALPCALVDGGGNPIIYRSVISRGCNDQITVACNNDVDVARSGNCSSAVTTTPCEDIPVGTCADGSAQLDCTNKVFACDIRTAQMITDGCQPCGSVMEGAIVTVTDANGDSVTKEIHA